MKRSIREKKEGGEEAAEAVAVGGEAAAAAEECVCMCAKFEIKSSVVLLVWHDPRIRSSNSHQAS